MALNDLTHTVMTTSLSALDARQKVLANNVANVNTPGFKRSEMEFEGALSAAISSAERGRIGALRGFRPAPVVDATSTMRSDGNNVDIDVEMARLSENQVRYNTMVEILSKRMKMLRHVVTDGRG